MRFEQPEVEAAVADRLRQMDVRFREDEDGLILDPEAWDIALSVAEAISEEMLPAGRSSSFNFYLKEQIESAMTDQGIPFDNRCIDGSEWTIWSDDHSAMVEAIRDEAIAAMLDAVESGELQGEMTEAECD